MSEKCPECGTWWRGTEHRCPPVIATTSTNSTFNGGDPELLAEEVRRRARQALVLTRVQS